MFPEEISLDVGSGPCDNEQASLLGCVKQRLQVIDARHIHNALFGIEKVPMDIDRESIKTSGLGLLGNVLPESWNRKSPSMEFAWLQKYTFSVDVERVGIPSYQVCQSSRVDEGIIWIQNCRWVCLGGCQCSKTAGNPEQCKQCASKRGKGMHVQYKAIHWTEAIGIQCFIGLNTSLLTVLQS